MLVRVMRCKGRTPDVAAEAAFAEAGGTIGRSSQCTLALPDPERHISRIQAEITWSGTAFMLTDRGSGNPTLRNGEAVGRGKSVPLTDGDELHVGDYVLRVEMPQQRTALRGSEQAGPFSELVSTARNLDLAPDLAPQGDSLADPFAPARRSDGLIPDDFDPFGKSCLLPDLLARRQPAAPAQPTAQPEDSIDALFGLGEPGADPLGIGTPLGAPSAQPNTAASSDPLLSLQSAARRSDAPMADYLPEIHTPMPMPVPMPAARMQPGAGANEGDNAFRSWESSDGVGSTAINPGRHREAPPRPAPAPVSVPPAPGVVELPETSFGPSPAKDAPASLPAPKAAISPAEPLPPLAHRQPPPPASLPPASPPPAPLSPPSSFRQPASQSALLAALLAGAGLREAPSDPVSGRHFELDEGTMERIGSLLRLLSQGIIDLLATRTTLKSEMHAAVTVIAAQGNNPLKFSPDASAALAFLLAADTPRGFMPPEAAVEDAARDLLAHQMGVLSGMRAALAGVLQRFEPQQLEARLAPKSLLGGVLPMNRKARLWEQFEALYGAVSREAEDDFETLFSEAFVRAYEEQIAALKKQSPASRNGNPGER